jgi:hypothetical protein
LKFLGIVLYLFASGAFCDGQVHSLVTNLQYRLTSGDLGEITPAPFSNSRTLRIEKGGDLLLKDCREQGLKWAQDSILFRLAHLHAASSISCRERSSPSMHVVSYPMADGSIETRIHFDLHGPNNPLGHFGEIVRNRLTFGRTSEYAVYRGLVRSRKDPNTAVPAPAYNYSAHAADFYKAAFGPRVFATAVLVGAARSAVSRNPNWGDGRARYVNRIEANLANNAIRQAIEFGVAAALQQRQTAGRSNEEQFGKRMKSALYRSFIVPGRGGDELAFPRIAAALGAGWTAHAWHPWSVQAPDPWVGTAINLSRYVLRSYWREFRPDIKQQFDRGRRLFTGRR